jgi:hypothetical protein
MIGPHGIGAILMRSNPSTATPLEFDNRSKDRAYHLVNGSEEGVISSRDMMLMRMANSAHGIIYSPRKRFTQIVPRGVCIVRVGHALGIPRHGIPKAPFANLGDQVPPEVTHFFLTSEDLHLDLVFTLQEPRDPNAARKIGE